MSVDDSCKLFVAGLPDSISETVLRQLFEAAGGTVVDVSLPRDRATGRPRGFAFVTLSSEQQARQARDALDGSVQAGRAVSVRPFQAARRVEGGRAESTAGAEERTLYLGNLPYDATVAEVEELFARLGLSGVVRVNLPQDAQRRPRGFGFVTLSSVETAQAAVNALQNAELKGRRVSASIAHGKGERPNRPPMHAPGGAPPMRQERSYDAPEPDQPPVAERETFDEPRRGDWSRRKKEKEPAPKKKKKARGATERVHSRRENEGLRSPRARGWLDEDD